MEHLRHACQPCISRIIRKSLIKRVVILHPLKSFLSLWLAEVVGACFRLVDQCFSFKKQRAWCYNIITDKLLPPRVTDDHPILVYHVLVSIIILNYKAILQTRIQLVRFTVDLDGPRVEEACQSYCRIGGVTGHRLGE